MICYGYRVEKVSVLVPYAGTCPHRAAAWEWIRPRYEALGWEICRGYGDPNKFHKADAVADALAQTSGDLLVIADADCWTPRVEKAAWWVGGGHVPWAIPYTSVYRLTEQSTAQVFRGDEPARTMAAERVHDAAIGGGIVVLPRVLYERIPLDGRFEGWGGEDFAWGYALAALAAPPGRLSGLLWHLWHPHAYDRTKLHNLSGSPENEALRARYEAAKRNRAAMAELIEEAKCNLTRRSPSSTVTAPAPSTAT